ncbi:MAG TPA: hypothetical protein VFY80_06750, partial [Burkholderiales bacterium]|nr:hypothetical protein [Burkholderiales bacterium]
MSYLAREFRAVGTELPIVAFARLALAPFVCGVTLMLCMLVYGEPLTERYVVLTVVVMLVALRVFGEMPLTNGRSLLIPGRSVLTDWMTVAGMLLFVGFITKTSDLYSRKLLLTWFVMTPFALHVGQELARQLLCRFVSVGALARTKVIVGLNEMGHELAREIAEDPCRGVLKGFFDDRGDGRIAPFETHPLLGGVEEVARYVKENAI